MRKIKAMLAFTLIILSQLQLLGKEAETPYQLKHYVQTEQISFCEDGIILFFEEIALVTESLFHDANGFYFLEEEGVHWICRNCGALNDLDNVTCYNCGKR